MLFSIVIVWSDLYFVRVFLSHSAAVFSHVPSVILLPPSPPAALSSPLLLLVWGAHPPADFLEDACHQPGTLARLGDPREPGASCNLPSASAGPVRNQVARSPERCHSEAGPGGRHPHTKGPLHTQASRCQQTAFVSPSC